MTLADPKSRSEGKALMKGRGSTVRWARRAASSWTRCGLRLSSPREGVPGVSWLGDESPQHATSEHVPNLSNLDRGRAGLDMRPCVHISRRTLSLLMCPT